MVGSKLDEQFDGGDVASAAAHINAVWPRQLSCLLTSAPRANRSFMGAGRPVRAAVINTVSPSGEAPLGLAPALRRRSIMAAEPLRQAR